MNSMTNYVHEDNSIVERKIGGSASEEFMVDYLWLLVQIETRARRADAGDCTISSKWLERKVLLRVQLQLK